MLLFCFWRCRWIGHIIKPGIVQAGWPGSSTLYDLPRRVKESCEIFIVSDLWSLSCPYLPILTYILIFRVNVLIPITSHHPHPTPDPLKQQKTKQNKKQKQTNKQKTTHKNKQTNNNNNKQKQQTKTTATKTLLNRICEYWMYRKWCIRYRWASFVCRFQTFSPSAQQ